MAKHNTDRARPAGTSPSTTERTLSGVTFEGAPGYARPQVGVVPAGLLRDRRRTRQPLAWLRDGANMRTGSVVGAAEFVRARLDAARDGLPVDDSVTSRSVVDSVLQHADEPGELLAYWTTRYGRAIPKPVKRGGARWSSSTPRRQ